MDQKLSVDLPVKLNLYEVVTTPPFEHSQERKDAIKLTRQEKTKKAIILLILWPLLFLIVSYVFSGMHFFGHTLAAIAIAIFGGGMLLGFTIPDRHYNDNLYKAKNEHCRKIIEELKNSNFPGFVYFYYEDNGLIYNNDICAYVSIKTGQLVIYNNSNIKQINAERVLSNKIGFVITNIGGGTVSGRQGRLHEWRVEIMTNFLEYPIISFNVGDTKYYEDELKKASAILCS